MSEVGESGRTSVVKGCAGRYSEVSAAVWTPVCSGPGIWPLKVKEVICMHLFIFLRSFKAQNSGQEQNTQHRNRPARQITTKSDRW